MSFISTSSPVLIYVHLTYPHRSGRDPYGDSAVGWVQVQRIQNICTVKAKITPEHNVKKKQYAVTCVINEIAEKVLDLQCHDCAASLGGCKHVIAFLMWLHRRSEEPSPTEVACCWAKSKLSKVGSSIKFLTLRDLGAEEELSFDDEGLLFLQEVVKKGTENTSNSQLLKYFVLNGINEHLGLYQLLLKFVESPRGTQEGHLIAQNFLISAPSK
ncbi:uncharacterized protein LOC115883713 [Sitophilus oryzae]|uniref:Uncharacterized protein LOC115883713 n=1 Tax=Sitophilus oryzae TaxID=7048 RepID=A0A6J2Y2N6_SITOR|nr:uncharacterized protein LOC115883713 [Sitophilus oryzae]